MTIEELYREYSLPVYRFLLRMTGQEEAARELLQETFYQALIHVDRFEGRSSPYTWLCTIGKNSWFAGSRRRSREILVEELPPGSFDRNSTELSAEEVVIRREEANRIRHFAESLPEPYREVVLLHIYGDISLQEIAAAHGKSESWARVTWYRAKKMLREIWENGNG